MRQDKQHTTPPHEGQRTAHVLWPLVLCVSLRLVYALGFSNLTSENYWEYGAIARNVHSGFGYSLFVVTDDTISLGSTTDRIPFPSAYMPPGYPAFLYPFFFIADVQIRNAAIQCAQGLLAGVVTVLVVVLTRRKFTPRIAAIAGYLSAIQPDMIYAVGSYTPTIFYQAIILSVLTWINLSHRDWTIQRAAVLGLLMGVLVLFRTEAILFAALVLLYLLWNKEQRAVLVAGVVIILALLPWQVRNYAVFGRVVPLSTSLGVNFYRGHNPEAVGNWADPAVRNEIRALPHSADFELRLSTMYLSHGFDAMREMGFGELLTSAGKLIRLWVWDPRDERALHPVYRIIWLLVLAAFVTGLFFTRAWQRHWPEYLFLVFSSLTAVVFFPMPRHQTMMKVVCLPFAAAGIGRVMRWGRLGESHIR